MDVRGFVKMKTPLSEKEGFLFQFSDVLVCGLYEVKTYKP